MKKIVNIFLGIFALLISLIIVNITQTRDNSRLQTIENTSTSFNFYIPQSKISTFDELKIFNTISKKYKVSIVRTDVAGGVTKSVVYYQRTFPNVNFGLPMGNLFPNDSKHYSNRDIPTFTAINKIDLETMSDFYKQTSSNISGTYAVTSVDFINQEKILNELSANFDLTYSELTTPLGATSFSMINEYLIIFVSILLVSLLILILMIVSYSVSQIKIFGVKKLYGYSEFQIFKDTVLSQMIIILVTGLVIDICFSLYFSYHPKNFILSLIFSQIFLLMLFLFLNTFTYLIIQKVTIGKMLKNFIGFRTGTIIALVMKFMMVVVVTSLFVVLGKNLSSLSHQYKINSYWKNYGNYLTLNNVQAEGEMALDIANHEDKAQRKAQEIYPFFNNSLKAYYISSIKDYYDSPNGIAGQKANSYDLMLVNQNYLKTLSINNVKVDFKDNNRVFLVPESLRKNAEKIEHFCQTYMFNANDRATGTLTAEQIQKIKERIKKIKVHIEYYKTNLQTFTWNSDFPLFSNPIISVLSIDNIQSNEISSLDTQTAYPWKIKNTSTNIKLLKEELTKLGLNNEKLNLEFTTINSINQDWVNSYLQGISYIIVIVSISFILSIVASFVLLFTIIQAKSKKLAVSKIMGLSIGARYQGELITLISLFLIQMAFLIIMTYNLKIIIFAFILNFLEVGLSIVFIKRQENKKLVAQLKGE